MTLWWKDKNSNTHVAWTQEADIKVAADTITKNIIIQFKGRDGWFWWFLKCQKGMASQTAANFVKLTQRLSLSDKSCLELGQGAVSLWEIGALLQISYNNVNTVHL
jgi:hypothetical protein